MCMHTNHEVCQVDDRVNIYCDDCGERLMIWDIRGCLNINAGCNRKTCEHHKEST